MHVLLYLLLSLWLSECKCQKYPSLPITINSPIYPQLTTFAQEKPPKVNQQNHFQRIKTTVKHVGHDKTPVVVLDNVLPQKQYLSLRNSLRTRTDFYEGHGNKVNFPGKIAALDRLTVDPLIDAVLSSELLSRHFPPAMFDRKFISGFASILCNPWGKYERLFFFFRVVQLFY